MKLRDLRPKDAEPMLAWMHDPFVVEKFHTVFTSKTIEDCNSFIQDSCDSENIHLAITDDQDEYMGTVSLKHITEETAEFAIVVRRNAMGKGYAIWAMKEILKIGFEEYGLQTIYWCVARDNTRALRFYDKNGFERVCPANLRFAEGYTEKEIQDYIWYQVSA